MPIERVDEFISGVRADKSMRSEGYPNFFIFPVENQADFYVIKYIEPYEENKAMMGFNLASDELRRDRLHKARDTGEAISLSKPAVKPSSVL